MFRKYRLAFFFWAAALIPTILVGWVIERRGLPDATAFLIGYSAGTAIGLAAVLIIIRWFPSTMYTTPEQVIAPCHDWTVGGLLGPWGVAGLAVFCLLLVCRFLAAR